MSFALNTFFVTVLKITLVFIERYSLQFNRVKPYAKMNQTRWKTDFFFGCTKLSGPFLICINHCTQSIRHYWHLFGLKCVKLIEGKLKDQRITQYLAELDVTEIPMGKMFPIFKI